MNNKNHKNERQSVFSKNKKELDLQSLPDSLSKENLDKLDKEIAESSKPVVKNQKSLEALLFLGRLEKNINISGFNFKLQSITNREQKDIIAHLTKAPDEEKMFVLRTLTLSLSVREINDTPIDEFIGSDSLEGRVEFFNELSSNLVDQLFKTYTQLLEESEKSLKAEEIKN
jgi:hypothetical protein